MKLKVFISSLLLIGLFFSMPFSNQAQSKDSKINYECLDEILLRISAFRNTVPHMIPYKYLDEFKEKGLENPKEDLVNDLLLHKEFIPYEGVLGGTFYYINSSIVIYNEKILWVEVEDGHISGSLIFEYTVMDGGKIEWELVYQN